MLPIDRTSKTTLDNNLVNGITSDAPAVKASNDVVYNTVDELYNFTSGLVAGGALQPYPAFLSRQAFINGNFDVFQRGASFTNPSNIYTADRWATQLAVDTGTFPTLVHSRQNLTPGDIYGSFNYYNINASAAGTTSANQYYILKQPIENGTRLLCGAGKKVTISFWARSSIPGKKIGVDMIMSYGTGGAPTPSEIINGTNFALTTTWTKYTYTFTTNTLVGKTLGTNNDDYIIIELWQAWGANFQTRVGASTTESFSAAGNIDFAQIQLSSGGTVLPFQPRSFSEEFALCQRYYEKSYNLADVPGAVTASGTFVFHAGSVNPSYGFSFKVRKRIQPALTLYSNSTGAAGKIRDFTGALDLTATLGNNGESGVSINITGSATGNLLSGHFQADAEI